MDDFSMKLLLSGRIGGSDSVAAGWWAIKFYSAITTNDSTIRFGLGGAVAVPKVLEVDTQHGRAMTEERRRREEGRNLKQVQEIISALVGAPVRDNLGH